MNQELTQNTIGSSSPTQKSQWRKAALTLAIVGATISAQADYYLDGVLVKEDDATVTVETVANEAPASEEPTTENSPLAIESDPINEFEAAITYQGSYRADEVHQRASARSEEQSETLYDINVVVVTGDRDPVFALKNWNDYENDAIYEPMSEADIEAFSQKILSDLRDEGYMFATIEVYHPSLQLGFLKLRVHVGDKGEVRVSGNKNYTPQQILDKLEWKTGGQLNYSELLDDLYAVNINSHLNVETELKPRVDENGKRVVDVDLKVEEKFPIHLAWNLANDGVKEGSDWRSRLTMQWYNFTRANDLLTIQWTADIARVHQVNAGAVSYFRPINQKWDLILYGGGSSADFEEVIPQLDVVSSGWFTGFNLQRKFWETDESEWKATFGWLFQHSEREQVIVSNRQSFNQVNLNISTPRAQLSYAAKKNDKFGGRNFASAAATFVADGFMGSSGALDASMNQPGADISNFITTLQLARMQNLFGDRNGTQKWQLFASFDGQWTSGPVPTVFYKRIGGANSVRGYPEAVRIGDMGYNSTVELRAPIFSNFFPGMVRSDEYLQEHPEDREMNRLQFVAFYDHAYVESRYPLAHSQTTSSGGHENVFIHSVGFGARLGLTKFAQMKVDYGYPLHNISGSDTSGNVHFSFQLQR